MRGSRRRRREQSAGRGGEETAALEERARALVAVEADGDNGCDVSRADGGQAGEDNGGVVRYGSQNGSGESSVRMS